MVVAVTSVFVVSVLMFLFWFCFCVLCKSREPHGAVCCLRDNSLLPSMRDRGQREASRHFTVMAATSAEASCSPVGFIIPRPK